MGRHNIICHSKGHPEFGGKVLFVTGVNRMSASKADNFVNGDIAVMVAPLVVWLMMDFACMLLADIHEWAFKTSINYLFDCLIFQLFKDS